MNDGLHLGPARLTVCDGLLEDCYKNQPLLPSTMEGSMDTTETGSLMDPVLPDHYEYLSGIGLQGSGLELVSKFIERNIASQIAAKNRSGRPKLIDTVCVGGASGPELGRSGESSTGSVDSFTPDNDFLLPKGKKRRFSTNQVSFNNGVLVSNKFEALAGTSQPETAPETTTSSEAGQPRADTPGNPDNTEAKEKIPPVVLRDPALWTALSRTLNNKGIKYLKAKSRFDGIHIIPASVKDFRDLTRFLDGQNIQYHSFSLRSERSLKVVIRGVPLSIKVEEVMEDLKTQGYDKVVLSRLVSKQDKELPLVKVELPRLYKNIYNLTTICGLSVTVESLYKINSSGQCHRCQLYGHSQAGCRAAYKCMKCGEGHSTHLCTKPLSLPPKCANCGGEHVSNYNGCPSNPKNRVANNNTTAPKTSPTAWQNKARPPQPLPTQPRQQQTAQQPRQPQPKTTRPKVPPIRLDSASREWPSLPNRENSQHSNNSGSNATQNQKQKQNPLGKKDEVCLHIGQLFLCFSRKNPTTQEQVEFLGILNLLTKDLTD